MVAILMLIDFSYGRDFDNLFESLKAYEHFKSLATLDGIGEQTDMVKFSRRFFSKQSATADVSVDSNANVEDSSIIAYEAEVPKPLFRMNAYYLLWKYGKKLFGNDVAERLVKEQFFKNFYINDFHKFAVCPYCFNFSCLDVVFNGLPFVKKIKSEPPKHFSSYVNQMIQFVTYASNSVAGAVGLADFLICASWYVDKEKPDIKEIRQELQSFIFSVNQPFRGGHQSAFTNVSLFDSDFLTKLCGEYSFPDGSKPNKDTVQKLQVIYMKTMNETLRKTPCTFPVTTACFSVDEDRNVKDNLFLECVCAENLEFGWINFYAGSTSTLSSCCRLRSDSAHEYFNTFGAGGTKIGSLSVTTINLPRIAYEAKRLVENKELAATYFLTHLQELVRDVGFVNQIKRYIVSLRIKNGNLPLYTLGFMDIKKQYSTCGLNGINEAVEILGYDVLEEDGQHLIKSMLTIVNRENESLEKMFGYPHNCEQTPSENSAIKLAQADKIMGFNDKYDLYSNQFIPLTTRADLIDRVMLQGMFDSLMTGGAILHMNVAEKISNVEDMAKLIKASVARGVIYQAINYVLNVCENGHVTVGKNDTKCSICGKKITDKLTRVVGFLTNTKNWHKVRREEDFPNREFY
jgi:anaerobic ribonucleoside-triphosphate reductase